MSGDLTYFIGPPGSGKTTLINALTQRELGWVVKGTHMFPTHTVYDRVGVVQIGAARSDFGGTDILAMNIQPIATDWLRQPDTPQKLFAEGDRLANDKFFKAAVDFGWNLTVVLVDIPDDVAAQRRAERGSNQNETWIKGRVTKVRRLAETWESVVKRIDGTHSTSTQLSELHFVPVVKEFFH